MAKYNKVYLNGGATEKTFEWGAFLNVSINLEDAMEKGAIKKVTTKDGSVKSFLNFTLSERKEVSEWGQTHSAYLSVLEDGAKAVVSPKGKAKEQDDLPF